MEKSDWLHAGATPTVPTAFHAPGPVYETVLFWPDPVMRGNPIAFAREAVIIVTPENPTQMPGLSRREWIQIVLVSVTLSVTLTTLAAGLLMFLI